MFRGLAQLLSPSVPDTATPPEEQHAAPALPPATGADRDAYDAGAIDFFFESPKIRVAFPDMEIAYLDIEGRRSHRQIRVSAAAEAYDPPDYFLHAFCTLRNANRTFRATRIAEIVDLSDGVVYSGQDAFAYLAQGIQAAPSRRVLRALDDPLISDSLYCLHYIARADGRVTEEERRILACYVGVSAGLREISRAAQDTVGDALKDQTPTLQGFRRARNRIKRADEIASVLEIARMIASTRKSKSAPLEAALSELAR